MKEISQLEQELNKWKAAHDNQVKLRRALMDRPDLKERAVLVTRLAEELAESERMRDFFEKGMDETATERDQLRKVVDAFNYCHSHPIGHWRCNAGECQVCKTIELYNQLPHVIEQRKTK